MAARRLRGWAAGVFMIAPLILTACGGDGSPAAGGGGEAAGEELVPVRFAPSTVSLGPAQSPYSSIPLHMGYWEEDGLDVEIVPFAGSGATIQAVDADQVDAGIASTTSLIPAIGAGANLISYYDQITRNFQVPAVPEDSPIQTVADFEGATIGAQTLESGTIPAIEVLLEDAGVPLDSVEFVAIGTGAQAAQFIRQGRVDVVGLWDSPRAEIENLGIPLRVVAPDDLRELGYNYAMFAPQPMLEEQRDVLIGLARGVAKASVFADENPEAAVRITWEVYPERRPTGVPEEEALAQGVRVLQARQENTVPIDEVWGLAEDEAIQTQMQFQLDAGNIEEPIPVDEIYTEALLEEINNFDEEAIREQARNYTPE